MRDAQNEAPAVREITLDEQEACVLREIALRERVYPQRIRDRRMSEGLASLELMRMRAVLSTVRDRRRRELAERRAELIGLRQRGEPDAM